MDETLRTSGIDCMPKKHKVRFTYPKIIAFGFFCLIAIGTLLLMLPIASRDGHSAGFLTALFTSTSASCVTGLVVVDTYAHWSLFGQIVIITLIQIGGLGFMTILTLFSFLLRRRIGLNERNLLRESFNTMYIGGIIRLTRKILFGTLLFEGAGAVLLATRFIPKMGLWDGLFASVFTSISAFCNAGFDLMGRFEPYSSLVTVQNDTVINFVIMALIIIGGIGFFVWDDLSKNKLKFKKYKLHTKIVLTVTGALILLGTLAFFVLERNSPSMEGMNLWQRLMASMFSAVTPRTAGFNTIDTAALTPGSKLLTVVLMFIGGSPGSTAGGIKTTSFAIILICVWANCRNKSGANVFKRRLEASALSQATSVVTINLLLVLTATLLIAAVQPEIIMSDLMVETFSAIGTVGMSTGVTRALGDFARVILIILMYSGRVGSLSFALLFTEKKAKDMLQLPQEKINIG